MTRYRAGGGSSIVRLRRTRRTARRSLGSSTNKGVAGSLPIWPTSSPWSRSGAWSAPWTTASPTYSVSTRHLLTSTFIGPSTVIIIVAGKYLLFLLLLLLLLLLHLLLLLLLLLALPFFVCFFLLFRVRLLSSAYSDVISFQAALTTHGVWTWCGRLSYKSLSASSTHWSVSTKTKSGRCRWDHHFCFVGESWFKISSRRRVFPDFSLTPWCDVVIVQ